MMGKGFYGQWPSVKPNNLPEREREREREREGREREREMYGLGQTKRYRQK